MPCSNIGIHALCTQKGNERKEENSKRSNNDPVRVGLVRLCGANIGRRKTSRLVVQMCSSIKISMRSMDVIRLARLYLLLSFITF